MNIICKYDVIYVHTPRQVLLNCLIKILSFFVIIICLQFVLLFHLCFVVTIAALLLRSVIVDLIAITFYGVLYKYDDCVTEQEDEICYVDSFVSINSFYLSLSLYFLLSQTASSLQLTDVNSQINLVRLITMIVFP